MKCNLCPHHCNVDRGKGEFGYCKAPNAMVVARYSRHMWEEPVISGDNGSGTIFFSYCNMGCIFCQNYELSELHKGKVISVKEFSAICLELQKSGVHNINLVTPTMFVPHIIMGISLAKENGLKIPVVYNTSSYENVDTIKMLDGTVDVYLPDLKYYDDKLGKKYSHVDYYFKYASKAIDEMIKQVGSILIEDGIIKRGVIVRHLIIPGCIDDSKRIIKYLYDTYGDSIIISIMNQYTPVRKCKYIELNRVVSDEEYNEVIDYAYDIGIRNAFVQDGETMLESFIPDFDQFCEL